MKVGSRSAVLSVLLVLAVSVAVFASSSLALSDVSASSDVLPQDYKPFASVETKGSVKVKNDDGGVAYKLRFAATLRMHQADARSGLMDELGDRPDVMIIQSIRYPVLNGQVEFVGPVGLPFDSEELGLQIGLLGECFDRKGAFEFGDKGDLDVKCTSAFLTLGDERFDVGDLLTEVKGRVWHTGRDGEIVKMHFKASFDDPGYPFPIMSLGDGSTMTVFYGPFGGTADLTRASFGG